MQEKLTEVKESIKEIGEKLEQKKEDERKVLVDSIKTSLTVENLPRDATEELLSDVFGKFPGMTNVFVNQAK